MSFMIEKRSNESSSKEFELDKLVGEFIDNRRLIIFITTLFTLAAIFYALFSTPIYQADAMIQLEQKQGNAILSSLSQVLPDSQPASAPEVAILKSKTNLGKTVDDLSLQAEVTQRHFPVFGNGFDKLLKNKPSDIEFGRFFVPESDDTQSVKLSIKVISDKEYQLSGYGDDLTGKVGELLSKNGLSVLVKKIDAKPGDVFDIKYVSRSNAIENTLNKFSAVDMGKETGILNLSYIDPNPKVAERILASITQNYLEQNIDRESAQDTKSLEFLQKQLPDVRDKLDIAEDKLSQYRKRSDSVDLNLQARTALEQIVNVDNQLNQLTFREAEVSQLYTKEHPTYKALLEKRDTLNKEKEKLNQEVSGMPSMQQQVLRLSRDVESGRAVYMQLLNREQELEIAKNSAIGNVRIIDNATAETKPIKPKKILVVLVGVVLGAILASGLVLLKSFLRRGVEVPEQLEALGINVMASIPVSEWLVKEQNKKSLKKNQNLENKILLARDNPTDLAIEALRSLRTSLYFVMMEAKNNILMVSSASPNAGKTFITSNLASVIAQTGKKTILLDADMRKGYAHELFDKNSDVGISSYLSGVNKIDEIVHKIEPGGFDFIARGKSPDNPSELLMNIKFKELLDWANENYDLVIVDTPPILAVTDPSIIGRHCGTSLLIARFESNSMKEIEVSIKRFEQSGVNIDGCILNGIIKKSSSYYSYGYNHYGYSYDDK